MIKAQISGRMAYTAILGENPSEEVDDYEYIARNYNFWWVPEIDFRYETGQKSDGRLQI